MKRVTITLWPLMLALAVGAAEVAAHPMGNFSINHYSGLDIQGSEIRVRYVLDLAEIPTFQEMNALDRDGNGEVSTNEREQYAARRAKALAVGLVLQIGDQRHEFLAVAQNLEIVPGAGGLATLKLTVDYRTMGRPNLRWKDQPTDILYRDENYPGRAGWKEMAVAGSSAVSIFNSSLPTVGSELRRYVEASLQSPPQVIEARFQVASAAGRTPDVPVSLPDLTVVGPRVGDRLAGLMSSTAPQGVLAVTLALLVAFGLGAAHALSPGHGKTLVAAYLVGSQGTSLQALLLGLTVTASHTIGVFVLGLVTLYLSKFIVPDELYPWLGMLSGLMIALIGCSLLRQRWRGRHEGHGHHAHPHPRTGSNLGQLLSLGVSGGIVPCPSALVVLLSAVAFHQIAFGLFLIMAFSAGIAFTIVGIGFLLVWVGDSAVKFAWFRPWAGLLPVVSAAGVAFLGGLIGVGSWLRL